MTDKITPEFLESIGIFELREIGREIGVYSPTTLKRNILVNKILEIYQGKAKPIVKNNRGRPVKISGNTKELVTNFKNQAELNYEFSEADKSMLILREPITTFDAITAEENQQCVGILDIMPEGYGIIKVKNYSASELDSYLSQSQIAAYSLKSGDLIQGMISKSPEKKYNAMHTILAVNDVLIDKLMPRKNFESLTPIYPNKKIVRFSKDMPPNIKVLNLIAPVGMGQRSIVYAPNKFDKINFLVDAVNAIKNNDPQLEVISLLIGELPEEITEIKRSILGEIAFTNFDELPDEHIKTSELVLSRAKRLAEAGKNVVLFVDNLNKLARAYSFQEAKEKNIAQPTYHLINRFFGAARNLDEGGSLSIIAFANFNTDTSDDLLCKDLKDTANNEIYLKESTDGLIIDIANSGTIRKELLLDEEEIECGKIIKNMFETNYDNAIKQILPLIKAADSVKELNEKLKRFAT